MVKLNIRYQITLSDVLDHDTILWEGDDLGQARLEMEHIKNYGPEGYDQYVTLEEVYYDTDPDDVIEYNLIDEIIWYETVEDWEEANDE